MERVTAVNRIGRAPSGCALKLVKELNEKAWGCESEQGMYQAWGSKDEEDIAEETGKKQPVM
jgi:hypothetical protein